MGLFKIYICMYLFIYLVWLGRVFIAALRIFTVACVIFFFFLVVTCGIFLVAACRLLSFSMHAGSGSLTRDRTWAPCIGNAESYSLDHQGSPRMGHFEFEVPLRHLSGNVWYVAESQERKTGLAGS